MIKKNLSKRISANKFTFVCTTYNIKIKERNQIVKDFLLDYNNIPITIVVFQSCINKIYISKVEKRELWRNKISNFQSGNYTKYSNFV